jgi:hypothetical protein
MTFFNSILLKSASPDTRTLQAHLDAPERRAMRCPKNCCPKNCR